MNCQTVSNTLTHKNIHSLYKVGYFILVEMMDCVFIGTVAAKLHRAHNETLILLPSISFLPSSSPLYLYSLSLSCLHSHEECRQVGLICCIGHCQSSSLSCGNRSLMISVLRLSCLCYIYFGCWAAPPSAVPSGFCVFLPLYQILTEIFGVFK